MKVRVTCENCGYKLNIDTATLPKVNPIALRADKTGKREVYVDCPRCQGETAAQVPIAEE